jgi:hypothetical protein
LAYIRNGTKGPEVMDVKDGWRIVYTVKATDYDYSRYPIDESEWTREDAPLTFMELEENTRGIRKEGPSFQIVPDEESGRGEE